jgi:hypothetical protein
MYLRVMPAVPFDKGCPALAREHAREVIESWGSPPRSRLVHKTGGAGEVQFELFRTDPKPLGELVLGRVLCQDGALAVASCSGPMDEESVLRPLCEAVLSSLRIRPSAAPQAHR